MVSLSWNSLPRIFDRQRVLQFALDGSFEGAGAVIGIVADLVQRLQLGIDLGAQPRGRLVDQVDGLVGQVAIVESVPRRRRSCRLLVR
jgi:hypothetical protein